MSERFWLLYRASPLWSRQSSVDHDTLLKYSLNSGTHISGLLCIDSLFLILLTQNPIISAPPQGLGFYSAKQEWFETAEKFSGNQTTKFFIQFIQFPQKGQNPPKIGSAYNHLFTK